MFALLQLSNAPILGYLCVIAGFLVIVASVVFVIKGKAVLSDAGAPNAVTWGTIKVNLTSAIFLFVLGSAMVALPCAMTYLPTRPLRFERPFGCLSVRELSSRRGLFEA